MKIQGFLKFLALLWVATATLLIFKPAQGHTAVCVTGAGKGACGITQVSPDESLKCWYHYAVTVNHGKDRCYIRFDDQAVSKAAGDNSLSIGSYVPQSRSLFGRTPLYLKQDLIDTQSLKSAQNFEDVGMAIKGEIEYQPCTVQGLNDAKCALDPNPPASCRRSLLPDKPTNPIPGCVFNFGPGGYGR